MSAEKQEKDSGYPKTRLQGACAGHTGFRHKLVAVPVSAPDTSFGVAKLDMHCRRVSKEAVHSSLAEGPLCVLDVWHSVYSISFDWIERTLLHRPLRGCCGTAGSFDQALNLESI